MNTFGRLFRIHIFGESHGPAVGITLDGCPPGISLSVADFEKDIQRRKSGARGTTPRIEEDIPNIISGVFEGKTSGAPICILFENNNAISKEYSQVLEQPRPGHADFVAAKKYSGFADYRGGGHFSGRLTLALVAAGVVAKKIVSTIGIEASLIEAGGESAYDEAIEKTLEEKDSIGGVIECKASPMPVALGEPFFDSLESLLSHLIFSIPAVKGIEFGSGFQSARMKGSQHNDAIIKNDGTTATNHAGGINGGLSNGNPLVFRVAIKPTSSIGIPQDSINLKSSEVQPQEIKGRHDACIALRVPPIIEAATAIVLADLYLIHGK